MSKDKKPATTESLPNSQLKLFENDCHAVPAHHFADVMDEIARFI
jgi:hypothetical protein